MHQGTGAVHSSDLMMWVARLPWIATGTWVPWCGTMAIGGTGAMWTGAAIGRSGGLAATDTPAIALELEEEAITTPAAIEGAAGRSEKKDIFGSAGAGLGVGEGHDEVLELWQVVGPRSASSHMISCYK